MSSGSTSTRCSPRSSPTPRLGPRPQAAWHWPSNACISAVSSPTVTSWLRPCATRRSSLATPPPTSLSASTPPARRRRPIPRWRRSWRRYGSKVAIEPMIECGASLARTSAPHRCPLSPSSLRPPPTKRIGSSTRCVATADSHSARARPCSCTSGPPTTSNSRSMAVACGRQSPSRTASAMSRSDERP